MKNNATPPIYSQVAFDIATKIATGELEEGQKFTGRSLMSSQYGVSPETIRRALKQLSDMEMCIRDSTTTAATTNQLPGQG